MNKNIFRITTIMIIILTLILVIIFINYLSKSDDIINRQNPTTHISGEDKPKSNDKEDNADSIINLSGDERKDEPLNEPSGELTSTEVVKEDETIKMEDKKEQANIILPVENNDVSESEKNDSGENNNISTVKIDFKDNTQDPVISSSTETSNQEKQQVLNELDDALQGLLEAVSKVPTVDESKLDASLESEVQP